MYQTSNKELIKWKLNKNKKPLVFLRAQIELDDKCAALYCGRVL